MPAVIRTRIAQDVNVMTSGLIAGETWNDSAYWKDADVWTDGEPFNVNPPVWSGANLPTVATTTSVTMKSDNTLLDADGNEPTYIWFEEIGGNPGGGNNSGWILYSTQNIDGWLDEGLTPNTEYTYRHRGKNSIGYFTEWSTSESVTTPV